jgi:hypothetical protein
VVLRVCVPPLIPGNSTLPMSKEFDRSLPPLPRPGAKPEFGRERTGHATK